MWIVLNGPNGMRRVPENTPYRLGEGEYVYGSAQDHTEQELHQELAAHGMRLGDAVASLIKATRLDKLMRKQNCTPCAERQRILNNARELGVRETVRQLVETLNETRGK